MNNTNKWDNGYRMMALECAEKYIELNLDNDFDVWTHSMQDISDDFNELLCNIEYDIDWKIGQQEARAYILTNWCEEVADVLRETYGATELGQLILNGEWEQIHETLLREYIRALDWDDLYPMIKLEYINNL